LRGYRIVTSWHDYPAAIMGRTEGPLLAWFAQRVKLGETWLDIGAHYGYTAIALSQLVGQQGRVFAFEPELCTAGYLSQTRLHNGLSQLAVLPYALGATCDLTVLQLPVTRGMIDSTIQQGDWAEAIHVVRLDWLWPRVCGDQGQIHGVKIDVQGMEIDVLHGMSEVLQTHRPKLVVEVHSGVNRAELLDLVEKAGYGRTAVPVEPVAGEVYPQYLDNHSYAFQPA
jgi:FkbM family methyltransferase